MTDFRFNIRHATANDLRRCRRFLRDIRENGASTKEARAKAAFVYCVQFAFHGQAGLDAVRPMVERKLGRANTILAEQQIATLSGNAKQAAVLLTEAHALATPDQQDRMLPELVASQLLCGDVDLAMETVLGRLRQGKIRAPVERWLALTAMQFLGSEPLVAAVPDIGNRVPRIRIAQAFGAAKGLEIPVYCLNLDRDAARFSVAQRALSSASTTVRRVPGVPGSALPQALLDMTAMPITVDRRAQVGCHLSHWSAWEKIAADLPEDGYAMVAEDDAVFAFGPGVGLAQTIEAARRDALEMVFLQIEPLYHRLAEWQDVSAEPMMVDPADVFVEADARKITGWGGEGYLLTAQGARKLLRIAAQVGIVAALDNQLLSYALCSKPNTGSVLSRDLDRSFEKLAPLRHRDPDGFVVRAAVAWPPLILQADHGYKPHNVETVLERMSPA